MDARRVTGKADPYVDLLERILSRDNMLEAWKRVKASKGAPGIDNMPVEAFMLREYLRSRGKPDTSA